MKQGRFLNSFSKEASRSPEKKKYEKVVSALKITVKILFFLALYQII